MWISERRPTRPSFVRGYARPPAEARTEESMPSSNLVAIKPDAEGETPLKTPFWTWKMCLFSRLNRHLYGWKAGLVRFGWKCFRENGRHWRRLPRLVYLGICRSAANYLPYAHEGALSTFKFWSMQLLISVWQLGGTNPSFLCFNSYFSFGTLPVLVTESWQLTALETPLLVSGIAKTIAPLIITIPRRIPVFICCTEDSSCANYSYFSAKGDIFFFFFLPRPCFFLHWTQPCIYADKLCRAKMCSPNLHFSIYENKPSGIC